MMKSCPWIERLSGLALLALVSACSGLSGSSGHSTPTATGVPSSPTPSETAVSVPPTSTPSAPAVTTTPTPSANGTAIPPSSTPTSPPPSETATLRPSPTSSPEAATPTPRGELVVEASEGVGIIQEIPGGPIIGAAPRMPAQYRVTAPDEVRVETFVSNVQVPWALDFAPDGRLFFSERPGRIRVVVDGSLDPTPWATLDVRAINEGGLLGLALSPTFSEDGWVYVCYTLDAGGQPRNRVSRLREVNGRGTAEEILLDDIPGSSMHDGCRLKFGPDGKLYSSHGDAAQRDLAQDLGSLAGKILRLNPDGSIPEDNPFGPESPVYSYGHRNPQGLAFDPETGALFATEHGPSGELAGLLNYDEINIIMAGQNYGWPRAVGAPGVEPYRDPLLSYPDRAVPPAGATFYTSSLIPQWTENFFFTSLGSQHLQRVVLDGSHTRVVAIERLFEQRFSKGVYGRLRDVIQGPDGALYVSTSNRDGRAEPGPDDDRILRIVPAQ